MGWLCLAALQCSVDNLPSPFGDRRGNEHNPRSEAPDRDRFQAIVPAYTFQCSGRVTEWRACVQPGGMSNDQYYIQFQVWRPSGSGCYSLVGFNRPVDSNEGDEFLSPPGDSNDPLHRCVVLSVTEEDQIQVQSGDVVGYYVDSFKNGDDRDDGGIQWILGGNNVVVYYKDDLPREDIKPHYALPHPSSCGFQISVDSNSNSYSLSESMFATPIISLSIGRCHPVIQYTCYIIAKHHCSHYNTTHAHNLSLPINAW